MLRFEATTNVAKVGLACVPIHDIDTKDGVARKPVAAAVLTVHQRGDGHVEAFAKRMSDARSAEFPLPWLVDQALLPRATTIVTADDVAALTVDAAARRFFTEPRLAGLCASEAVFDPLSIGGDTAIDECALYRLLNLPTGDNCDRQNERLAHTGSWAALERRALASAVSRMIVWANWSAFADAEPGLFFEPVLALNQWMIDQQHDAPDGKVHTAVVLDVETTSLDWRTGRIIELALCPVRFDRRARIVGIGETHSWLEDPGHPLSAEITALTGITDCDVAGKHIDGIAAVSILQSASLLVAHNSGFDAKWITARFPDLAPKPWACSLRDIDWAKHGIESRKLGGLLAEVGGWFNSRHRTAADVEAFVALLTSALPSGRCVFAEMLFTARKPTLRVFAVGSPISTKAALKARGYRWNPECKCWWTEIAPGDLDAERAWLSAEAQCASPGIEQITCFERYR